MRQWLAVVALLCLVSCGSDSSPSPSPSPTPQPSTLTLSGRVTDQAGAPLGGATVTVQDGANQGKSAGTDGSGHYSLAGLSAGGFTAKATKQYYQPDARGVTLTANGTQDFAIGYIPPFTVSGTGDTVFDLPRSLSRVHIVGDYTKRGSNFIVWIDGDLVVNEIIGTAWESTHFEGTYLTGGGTVQIEKSSGVRWTFTEVR